MKFLPISGLIVAQLACLIAMLRFPRAEMPASMLAYTGTMAAFAIVCARGMANDITPESKAYYGFYWTFLAAAVTFSMFIACGHNLIQGFRLGTQLLIASFALCYTVAQIAHKWIDEAYKGAIAEQFNPLLLQAAFFSVAGIVSLVSLMAPHKPLSFALIVSFGGYSLGLGVAAFIFSIGIIRKRELFLIFNSFVPATLGIVAFGLLTLFLVRSQREISRQAAVSHEIVWEETE